MKIKRGDKVEVITGSYKGTIGEVLDTDPKRDRIIVEGVNLRKKHMAPSQMNPEGGIAEQESWIHVSNAKVYNSKDKKSYRVGYEIKDGKKVRVFKDEKRTEVE